MEKIELDLPVYYHFKNKKFLVSLSWYRNAHHHELNKVKKYYHMLIRSMLKKNNRLFNKYTVNYKYFYKNSRSDNNNVVGVIDKFFQDALQEIGIIENDNVKHYCGGFTYCPEQDKKNPRLHIEVNKVS